MRNGFSHGDSEKVLIDFPDQMKGFQVSIADSTNVEQVVLNQKEIPFMQSPLIDDFAKHNALHYFEFVFELMIKIEERLIEKN